MPWTGGRALGVAFGLGLLSALALPPIHALPVLLLAVPGLLALIGSAPTLRVALLRGFCFGFGHHLLGLYWLTDAILIEAARFWWLVPLAVPGLSAVLALYVIAACAVARAARPGWPRALTLAGAWVVTDLLRQFIATGFPWNLWGTDWAIPGRVGDVFIQPAAWIGAHGLTLATLLIAATPALGRRGMAVGACGLLAWAGFGIWRLDTPAPRPPGVEAVLVQGNIPQGEKWDRARAFANFDHYLDLTRQGLALATQRQAGEQALDRKQVVIWPESASPFLLEGDAAARELIVDAAGSAPVLAGSVRFDPAERPRNSMVAVIGRGPAGAVYDKWHLVPFGEYSPGWVPVAVQLARGGGFAPGPGPQTLRIPGLPPVGGLICYEAIFPAQVADPTDRPAWLVNVTNDAWFGNSTGPRQHLAAARLRAVEEGLPLLRAANTGISAAFDAFGHEQARLGVGVAGTVVTELGGALPPPPSARWGLAIPAALAALALLAGLAPTLLRRRKIVLKIMS